MALAAFGERTASFTSGTMAKALSLCENCFAPKADHPQALILFP
jgi:hypothetical protein